MLRLCLAFRDTKLKGTGDIMCSIFFDFRLEQEDWSSCIYLTRHSVDNLPFVVTVYSFIIHYLNLAITLILQATSVRQVPNDFFPQLLCLCCNYHETHIDKCLFGAMFGISYHETSLLTKP